jgi:hypothetical protein
VSALACLSACRQLLSLRVCSRGTRTGTQMSMPNVVAAAELTPGTVASLEQLARARDAGLLDGWLLHPWTDTTHLLVRA